MTIRVPGSLGKYDEDRLRDLRWTQEEEQYDGRSRGILFSRQPAGLHLNPPAAKTATPKKLRMPMPVEVTDAPDGYRTKLMMVFQRPKTGKKPTQKSNKGGGSASSPKEPWPLYGDGNVPNFKDVQQGNLLTCPLASILTAVAYTKGGPALIKGMITPRTAVPVTTYDPRNTKKVIKTNQVFTVKLAIGSVDVSEVLWGDDPDDAFPTPTYMRSPNSVLWPALIEKAYAALKKGYAVIGKFADPMDVWKDIFGKTPSFLDIRKGASPRASSKSVIRQAAKAHSEPMIVALNDIRAHGMAVTGVKGKSIKCWDAYGSKVDPIMGFTELREAKAVFYHATV